MAAVKATALLVLLVLCVLTDEQVQHPTENEADLLEVADEQADEQPKNTTDSSGGIITTEQMSMDVVVKEGQLVFAHDLRAVFHDDGTYEIDGNETHFSRKLLAFSEPSGRPCTNGTCHCGAEVCKEREVFMDECYIYHGPDCQWPCSEDFCVQTMVPHTMCAVFDCHVPTPTPPPTPPPISDYAYIGISTGTLVLVMILLGLMIYWIRCGRPSRGWTDAYYLPGLHSNTPIIYGAAAVAPGNSDVGQEQGMEAVLFKFDDRSEVELRDLEEHAHGPDTRDEIEEAKMSVRKKPTYFSRDN